MKSSQIIGLNVLIFLSLALPIHALVVERGSSNSTRGMSNLTTWNIKKPENAFLSLLEVGLDPTADVTSPPQDPAADARDWHVVYVLALLMLLAISPILLNNGISAFLVVVNYLTALTLVKIFVKQAMNSGYSYPYTITAMHMAATASVALLFDRPSMAEALLVLPISLVNGVGIALNNTSLSFGGVAFCTMISSCTPISTFIIEVVMGRREPLQGLFPVLCVCVGGILCVNGETTASVLCFILSAASATCRSLKGIWQHQLLQTSIPATRMVFWTGFWSFLGMLPAVIVEEGFEPWRALPSTNATARWGLILSIVTATSLNVSQVFALKALGPLMQNIIGNLNLIMVIALSAAMLHEDVTYMQYVGVLGLVAGAVTSKSGGHGGKKASEAEAAPITKETPDVKQYGSGN